MGKSSGLLPETAVVFAGDAPAFHYHTALPALSAPNESPDGAAANGPTLWGHPPAPGQQPPTGVGYGVYRCNPVESIQLIAEVDDLRLYELRSK
jgi:hypothetical protein